MMINWQAWKIQELLHLEAYTIVLESRCGQVMHCRIAQALKGWCVKLSSCNINCDGDVGEASNIAHLSTESCWMYGAEPPLVKGSMFCKWHNRRGNTSQSCFRADDTFKDPDTRAGTLYHLCPDGFRSCLGYLFLFCHHFYLSEWDIYSMTLHI